ncbi:uncharacterized protein PV07_00184 [Cladophialophora immunda]|uniref:GPI inositol-deacylase n=1 Tax=Cladophialophora immunda TaxID=569365 RepID=A0A0D2B6T8_9EURO|nr:uncharacterized protein PV07_00184 [Cladophialophora immunda]KIW33327.1 hypothetical protein PV07_00184 [Cladophialophora immunda]
MDEPTQSQINHLLQLESSDEFDQVRPRSEQGGLFCMYVPESRTSEALQYGSDVDIVAVHGLGGDPYRTWQHENGFNWLQRLHEELSGVRVYTFGYESGMAFSGGLKGLNDHARYLLYLIKRARPSYAEQKRKVVFVCHGMGGLLVKQALLLANNERGIFGSLQEAICGILFFSTPRAGARTQDYEAVLCQMADAIVFHTPAEKLMENFRTTLLESLRNIAEGLSELEDQFRKCVQGIHLSSFIEKSLLPDMSNMLVDEYSGRYGRLIPLLDHDHRQICKHPSFASPGMGNILSELRDIAQHKSAALAGSWVPALVIEPQDESAAVKTAASLRNEALLRAAATGNIRALERLIDKGADFNTSNSQSETALLLACQYGYADIALRLLDAGADVNGCDIRGKSPLHFASGRSDSELALRILNQGANPNLADKSSSTPLHCAAEYGNAAIVKHLLDHGANCFIRNSLDELPARIARKSHQLEAMRVLHSHAQNLNQESCLQLYHFEP